MNTSQTATSIPVNYTASATVPSMASTGATSARPVATTGAPETINMTSIPMASTGAMPVSSTYAPGAMTAATVPPMTAGATVAPLQAKGFYVPGAIETEDYTPLRRLHWILFALFLLQAIVILPLSAPLARGSIPMATAFSTFDPFRRIYVNQIQDRGYYQPGPEICVWLFIDALVHLINAIFFNKLARVWDRTGVDYVRYLLWAISIGWMCFLIALVDGMHEIVYTLIAVMFLTSTFIWFMMCQDLCNGNPLNRRTTYWLPWLVAFVVFAGWLITYWNYLFAYPFRGVEPRIVYAVVIFATFFLFLMWVFQGLQYANVKYFRTFVAQSRWQYGNHFIFSTLMAWLLFATYVWLFYTVNSNLGGNGTFFPNGANA